MEASVVGVLLAARAPAGSPLFLPTGAALFCNRITLVLCFLFSSFSLFLLQKKQQRPQQTSKRQQARIPAAMMNASVKGCVTTSTMVESVELTITEELQAEDDEAEDDDRALNMRFSCSDSRDAMMVVSENRSRLIAWAELMKLLRMDLGETV